MNRWTHYNRLIGASLMLAGVGGAFVGFFPLLRPHTPPVETRFGPTLHLSWQVAAADAAGHFAPVPMVLAPATPAPMAPSAPAPATPAPTPVDEPEPTSPPLPASEPSSLPEPFPVSGPSPVPETPPSVAPAAPAPTSSLPSPPRPVPTPLPAKAASQKPTSKPTATPKAHPAPPSVAQPTPPLVAQPAAIDGIGAAPLPSETAAHSLGAPSPSRSDTAASAPTSSSSGNLTPSLPASTPPSLTNHLEVYCDNRSPPSYPAAARRSSAEGIVTVRVQLLADGTIVGSEIDETQTSTSHPLLRAAALEAVRRWRCRLPSDFAGEQVVVLQPFRFQLQ